MNNKPLTRFILLVLYLLISNNAMSAGSEAMELYYLNLETKNAIVTVLLNGAPIIKSTEIDSISAIEPVNSWLLNDHNILSVVIESPHPTEESYMPSVSASIFTHDNGSETPHPREILSKLVFVGDEEANYPLTVSDEIQKTFSNKTKLWQEAIAITDLNGSDKEFIISLVNAFSTSLITNDVEKAIKLQRYKIEDDALAENKTFEQIENAVKVNYQWLAKQTGLIAQPLSIDNAEFTMCYNNKLIYVQRDNKEEAVALESDDLFFDVPIYVAKISGEWKIVR